jgi:peptidoglycan hydrolase-like protein with peptidoglycan-binding domain
MSFDRTRAHQGNHGTAASGGTHADPGKQTLVQMLPDPSKGRAGAAHDAATLPSHNGGTEVPVQAPAIEAVRNGQATIHFGESGQSVERIQHHLGITITGYFGGETVKAVEAFQHAHKLKVDGVVGQATIKVLIPESHTGGIRPHQEPPSGGVPPQD